MKKLLILPFLVLALVAQDQTIRRAGSTSASSITGIITVTNGGTGASTLTGVVYGNGTSPMTASVGTAGYFPKWSATAPFLTSTSLLFSDGTNVGVGTITPVDKFEVAGALHVSGTAAASKANEAYFDYITGGARIGVLGPDATTRGNFKVRLTESDGGGSQTPLEIQNDGDVLLAQATGNVGIVTTTFGTSASGNLVFGAGTAPTVFPADQVHLMGKDQNGTAGNAALHIYPEAGATNIIGKWVQFPGGLLVGGTVTTDPVGKLRVGVGIVNDGGGKKHARVTTGSINAASSALVTNTWTTAFADANYTVTYGVEDSTAAILSLRVIHIEQRSATGISIRVENTSAGALTGTLHIIAEHD